MDRHEQDAVDTRSTGTHIGLTTATADYHHPRTCPGCPCGGPRVGSRGNPAARVVIVGEAPGKQELKDRHVPKRPFIGPSGDLLQGCIPEGVDLERDALIINAMQCYVGSGETKNMARTERALVTCRPRLASILAEHPRDVIITLGGWAAMTILGDMKYKITQSRGDVKWIELEGKRVWVVPTFHPAFLLRGKGSLPLLREHIALGFQLAGKNYGEGCRLMQQWTPPECTILESPQEIHELRLDLLREGTTHVAADTETHTFRYDVGRLLCIGMYPRGFRKAPNTAFVVDESLMLADPRAVEAMDDLFAEPGIRWGWHNGKYDLKFLWHAGMKSARVDDDSILMSYALRESGGDRDLETLAADILGAPNYKGVMKRWAPKKSDSFERVPRPVLWDYLAKDVKNTDGISSVLYDKVLEDKHLSKLYHQTLIPASPLLAEVEMTGMEVDLRQVELNRVKFTEDMEFLDEQLRDIAGWYVNPNSSGQVQELLYDQLGLKLKGKRPKSTRKEVLAKFKGQPAVDTVIRFRKAQKMLSTYVGAIDKLRSPLDGRIHTTFSLITTPTGRLASKEPNVQNIPRDSALRRMYCAPPGKVAVEGDYNAAELRLLGAVSRDRFLTGIYLDNSRSLHDEVATEMYGVGFTGDQRIRAKAISFGVPYGRTGGSIEEEFDMPKGEGQILIDKWLNRAPEARDFLAKCAAAPANGQTLVTVFGRKKRPGVVSRERLHELRNEFRNFFMQSTVSDFTLHAAMLMAPHLKAIGARIINLVHDSILVECPEDPSVVHQCIVIMRYYMEWVPTVWMPFTPIPFYVDFKVGRAWGGGFKIPDIERVKGGVRAWSH